MKNIEKYLNEFSFGALLDYLATNTKNSKKLQFILRTLNIINTSFYILLGILLFLFLF